MRPWRRWNRSPHGAWYTPKKDQPTRREVEREQADAFAPEVAELLADHEPPDVDVVLARDTRIARRRRGDVSLVLAGHTHAREGTIDGIRPLVAGSTGGAGLQSLRGEEPEPLRCTVLYFDLDTDRLVADDRITVRGLGETGPRIERHVLDDPGEVGDE